MWGIFLDGGRLFWVFDSGFWPPPMFAGVMEENFGFQYPPVHVQNFFPGGVFSVQRPRRVLARADAAAQDRWHRRIYPALKKKPARDTGLSSSPTKPASGKTQHSTPPGAPSVPRRKSPYPENARTGRFSAPSS